MTAPEGFKIVTIGFGDGHQVGGAVNDLDYSGKRSVRVRLFTNNRGRREGRDRQGHALHPRQARVGHPSRRQGAGSEGRRTIPRPSPCSSTIDRCPIASTSPSPTRPTS